MIPTPINSYVNTRQRGAFIQRKSLNLRPEKAEKSPATAYGGAEIPSFPQFFLKKCRFR